jgi:hypothetical protein
MPRVGGHDSPVLAGANGLRPKNSRMLKRMPSRKEERKQYHHYSNNNNSIILIHNNISIGIFPQQYQQHLLLQITPVPPQIQTAPNSSTSMAVTAGQIHTRDGGRTRTKMARIMQ